MNSHVAGRAQTSAAAGRPGGSHRAPGLAEEVIRAYPGTPVLAGDLSATSATEVIQRIRRSRRSGALLVSGGAERALLFRNGEIVWATSSIDSERTDPLISRVDLAGKAVRMRLLLGHDALGIILRQAKIVLCGMLNTESGAFCFLESNPDHVLPEVPPIDTAALLRRCLLATGKLFANGPEAFNDAQDF